MRIAVFSDNFYPEIGGIQDSIEALGKGLAQRGHLVDFYVPRYGRRDYGRIKAEPREIYLAENIRICRLPAASFPTSTNQSRMVVPSPISWLRLLGASRPDVIHSQTFFGVGLNALLASRVLRVPIVGTNHTAIKAFDSYIPFGMNQVMAYVLWYYNKCDLVSAPSQSVFNEFGSNKLLRPHEIVSNPIATEIFHPVSGEERRESKKEFRLGGPTIAYAGRLAPEKNIDTILRAVALAKQRVPSVQLALAGHGSFESRLYDLARELQIEANVRFLGTLPQQTLAKLFQASDLFVTMSTSETQGMALLQAMACGTPAVGANARALPEYINEDCGFVVDPFDSKVLSERVVHLLESSSVRTAFGCSAASFARRFSTEAVVDRWESLYRNVLLQKAKGNENAYQTEFRGTRAQ